MRGRYEVRKYQPVVGISMFTEQTCKPAIHDSGRFDGGNAMGNYAFRGGDDVIPRNNPNVRTQEGDWMCNDPRLQLSKAPTSLIVFNHMDNCEKRPEGHICFRESGCHRLCPFRYNLISICLKAIR